MIKRTLVFSNPCKLRVKLSQLEVVFSNIETPQATVPIEDIGIILLEHPQITITHICLSTLIEHKVALITCNENYLPSGMFLPFDGHSTQTENIHFQMQASQPLKKYLWQQIVKQKIVNQAAVLSTQNIKKSQRLEHISQTIQSGDTTNGEAQAATIYWKHIFNKIPDFKRNRYGIPPNPWLNYGYTILRATVARAIVGGGLLPSLGIFHHNRYNSFCLADDIMEPFRPYVDKLIVELMTKHEPEANISRDIKIKLLQVPVLDITINKQQSPLMVGLQHTVVSLVQCYKANSRKLILPKL